MARNKHLVQKTMRVLTSLPSDIRAARRPPVFVAGFPRSGTTWLATVLGTAQSVEYYHEPFNCSHFPEFRPYHLRYVPADDPDQTFASYCRKAFEGKGRYVMVKTTAARHIRFDWWPRRFLVKETHALLALEWIQQHIRPVVLIALRHPCGVAASWARLHKQEKQDPYWHNVDLYLQNLLAQPTLMRSYLSPFRELLERADRYFEKVGALWGATYHVMLHQRREHPEWVVAQHEALCADPSAEYPRLFQALDFKWTAQTRKVLSASTSQHSKKPYELKRISAKEPVKWKKELSPEQIEQVRRFTRPFEIPFYADF